jgi:nitroimidazol reductase NimA-like FMN-containing flavoprotein (pyridoxamine 5'-phosphate oxidase superfamily)
VTTTTPSFRTLDVAECEALLSAHQVGRLAFSFRDRVDIEPIHYVYSEGWIYGRTSPGTKLRALTYDRLVAFEVDEVDALFSWRSVVVKGTLFVLAPEDDGPLSRVWEQAVFQLQRIVPAAFTAADPTPERTIIFRIQADQITGRQAIS